ncbi:MAG: beta-glucuronidase [Robiginitomaculum sp.]|nr:MAG: beta-glucuronidase [Robiginitomaculum sp.]
MHHIFKKTLACFGLVFLISYGTYAPAHATENLTLTNASTRNGQDLSGLWNYSIDPYKDGLYGFHGSAAGTGHQRFDPQDVDIITREQPESLYEYDLHRGAKTAIPSSWLTHSPEMRHYEGLVWYTRKFEAHIDKNQRAFLRFGAVNYSAKIYLNGKFIGEHEGGFTPFTFEITEHLLDGENYVGVGADSVRTNDSVPPPVTDWETYGGITRPVRLIITPETFIDDAWIRLGKDGKIAADITLNGVNTSQEITVSIPSLGFTMQGRTDKAGHWHGTHKAPKDMSLWSPDSPTLYDVQIKTGTDVLQERIGFRTIEVKGEDILLNGKPIFLRGISMHEEELGTNPSRIITEANARALLTEIKTGLNGNFVRLAHYPHSEITTRLADEIGIMVWSEIPVYWRINWTNPETLAVSRAMLSDNIKRDRNRASIILWSVGNETPISEPRNDFLRTLIADVRALDNTRLVTAALLTEKHDVNGTIVARIEDPLAGDLDVMAINTYDGWYGPIPLAEVHEIIWESDLGKPIVFSELGAGALAGFDEPDVTRKFSESYQAEYYRQTLRMSKNISALRGMSPWILKDFRSPRRQHPFYQQGWNRKGLISETGVRKQAFGVLAEHYREKQQNP